MRRRRRRCWRRRAQNQAERERRGEGGRYQAGIRRIWYGRGGANEFSDRFCGEAEVCRDIIEGSFSRVWSPNVRGILSVFLFLFCLSARIVFLRESASQRKACGGSCVDVEPFDPGGIRCNTQNLSDIGALCFFQ